MLVSRSMDRAQIKQELESWLSRAAHEASRCAAAESIQDNKFDVYFAEIFSDFADKKIGQFRADRLEFAAGYLEGRLQAMVGYIGKHKL